MPKTFPYCTPQKIKLDFLHFMTSSAPGLSPALMTTSPSVSAVKGTQAVSIIKIGLKKHKNATFVRISYRQCWRTRLKNCLIAYRKQKDNLKNYMVTTRHYSGWNRSLNDNALVVLTGVIRSLGSVPKLFNGLPQSCLRHIAEGSETPVLVLYSPTWLNRLGLPRSFAQFNPVAKCTPCRMGTVQGVEVIDFK